MKKILLVEDDPSFGNVLKDYLTMHHFDVTHALDGEEGFTKFREDIFDVCILDVMMPKKDGFTLAKELKAVNTSIPIIFLTAKALREDLLKGYEVGAEDYILKPFDSEVLLYKLNIVLHRKSIILEDNKDYSQMEFYIGDTYFNVKHKYLEYFGERIEITSKVVELLKVLCLYKNELMTRELALDKVWGEDNFFTSRSMDVYISKVRKIIKFDPSIEIENVHGEGFILREFKHKMRKK